MQHGDVTPESPNILSRQGRPVAVPQRVDDTGPWPQLAAIFASATEAIIGRSLEGRITFWNPAAEQIFGYSADEARDLPASVLLPPDRAEEEALLLHRLKNGGNIPRFETVRVRKDGRLIDVSLVVSPVKDTAGNLTGISLMAYDITESKTKAAKLERIEELYRRAIGGVGGVPYLYDYATRSYGFMGGGILELTGYSPEEMSPELWRQITRQSILLGEAAGLDRDEAIRRVQAGEIRCWRCDSQVVTKQGALRWIADTAIPDFDENNQLIASIGILQDVTDRKQSEQALRESEERFRRVVESNMIGILFWDRTGQVLDANDKFLSMVNYTREDITTGRLHWKAMTPPEYQALDEAKLEEVRARGFCQPFEKEYLRRNGSRIPVLIGAAAFSGSVDRGVCFVLDITERRLAEERLGALSELGQDLSAAANPREAASVIARITQGLFGWDALAIDFYSAEDDTVETVLNVDTVDGRRVEVAPGGFRQPPSQAARRVMALGATLLLKEEPVMMLPEESPFGDTSRPSASIMRVPIRHRNQLIGIISVHSYTVKAYNQSDLATLQTFADYCAGALERMRVEEKMGVLHTQLLNTARRAGMEEVATSVLHNIGNLLNSVNVSATLVMENLKKSELAGLDQVCALLRTHGKNLGAFLTTTPQGRRLPEYLEALAQYWAGEQASALKELEALNKNIAHIKAIISRQQSIAGATGVVEPAMISELLEDALALGGSDLERLGVILTREYTMHFPVIVDRMKLMLILVNLVSNARDALLGGSAQLKTLKVRSEAHQGDRLRIIVTDNGAGIAPENLSRIFSHGFTTKKTGHGFGLHSSALAAREMGGSLNVQSDGPQRGAVFTVELPLNPASKTDFVP